MCIMNKIAFFDIDGTLLNSEKEILVSTKEAIQALQENGVYTAIATGRNPLHIEDIRKELNINSYITLNGQYVVFENQVIYHNPIQKSKIREFVEETKKKDHPLAFYHYKKIVTNTQDHPRVTESFESVKFGKVDVEPLFFEEYPVYQIGLFCAEGEEKEYEEKFPHFDFVRWHPYAVDVLPKGASKLKGIEEMMRQKGFSHKHSYAFGDGLNDIQMLQGVGTGIAMGNAENVVKEVSDYITYSNDANGIYHALKYFKLI